MRRVVALTLCLCAALPAQVSTIPAASSTSSVSGATLPMSVPPGAVVAAIQSAVLGSGMQDLYVVPADKRLVVSTHTCYNTTGATITALWYVRSSGVDYPYSTALSSFGANNATAVQLTFVAEAGETLAISPSASGLRCYLRGFLQTAARPGYRRVSVVTAGLSVGDNLIYTAPAAGAVVLQNTSSNVNQVGQVMLSNLSGTTRTTRAYYVPSGGSPGVTYYSSGSVSVTNTLAAGAGTPGSIGPNESVWLNLDAVAGVLMVWMTVYEF